MGEREREELLRVYRLDWASVRGRKRLRSVLGGIVSPDFDSRLTRFAGSWNDALDELRSLGHSLEHDFERFSYEPDQCLEGPDDRFVVVGSFSGLTRLSQIEVRGEFGHVWKLEDGLAVRLEGYAAAAEALAAAGLDSAR